ncbi:hypothetical protein C8Q76DRAFT_13360 [Earliella scabrosa]|nr:hypothetical protein C8Q76DRAFT_13360 [Earliella scabrosa]
MITTDLEFPAIAQAVHDQRIISSATFALLLYDYILTLPREIEWYWRGRLSWASTLFFLNRYGVMLSHLPIMYKYYSGDSDSSSCEQLQLYHGAVSMVSQGIVSLLMVLRTYALYNFDPKIPILFTTITLIGGTVTTWALIQSMNAPDSGDQLHQNGCILVLPRSQGAHYAIAWSLALVFDVVVFCLTLIRTFRQALACRDGLFYLMLRDGAIFFGILMILYLSNVLTFVPGYQGCLATTTNILSSVLMTRMMLNIRDHGYPELPYSMCSEENIRGIMSSCGFMPSHRWRAQGCQSCGSELVPNPWLS